MSRGYGNAARFAAQAQATMTFAAGTVKAASTAAAAEDAIGAVSGDLGTGYDVGGSDATLREKIDDLQAQIDAITP